MDIAMVYYGSKPHPAHAGFADTVEADLIPCSQNKTTGNKKELLQEVIQGYRLDYDILISEGSRPLIASSINEIFNDTTVIYLCADQFFYDINYSRQENLLKKYFFNNYFKYVIDGVIAVSEFAAEFLRSAFNAEIPIRVVHPYIQDEQYNNLGRISPDLDSLTAVTVSSASSGMVGDYKGVDMLVDAWGKVIEEFPNARLLVVGEGHPDTYENQAGVEVLGYVDSLAHVMDQASLYIQPSRADTYPVSVLEALRAGLPTIVTRTTGNRSEIRTIDPAMVTDPTSISLSNTIQRYFSLEADQKENLSRISERRGEQYRSDIWTKSFAKEFNNLIDEID